MKKLLASLAFLIAATAFGQQAGPLIPLWNAAPYYNYPDVFYYSPSSPWGSAKMYITGKGGAVLTVAQNAAGTGMTVGGPYVGTATAGGCTTYPQISFYALTATTIGTITIVNPGLGCTSTPGGYSYSPVTGGTSPTMTTTLYFQSPLNRNPDTFSGTYFTPLNGGIPYPNGTPFFFSGTQATANANVSTVVCTSGYTCTNTAGNVTVTIGGTAASGTLFTILFGNYNGTNGVTLPTAPGHVVWSSSGTTAVVLAHGIPTANGLAFSTPTSVTASTSFSIDYNFLP